MFCYSVSNLCIFHYFFSSMFIHRYFYLVFRILCYFSSLVPFVTSISNVYIFRMYPPFFCLSVCLLHILLLKPMDLTLFLSQVCVSSITSVSSLCIFYLLFTSLCIHWRTLKTQKSKFVIRFNFIEILHKWASICQQNIFWILCQNDKWC